MQDEESDFTSTDSSLSRSSISPGMSLSPFLEAATPRGMAQKGNSPQSKAQEASSPQSRASKGNSPQGSPHKGNSPQAKGPKEALPSPKPQSEVSRDCNARCATCYVQNALCH